MTTSTEALTIPSPYLSRRELAVALEVSERTVARWQGAGMPAHVWSRRLIRYRLDCVEAWLARTGRGGGA